MKTWFFMVIILGTVVSETLFGRFKRCHDWGGHAMSNGSEHTARVIEKCWHNIQNCAHGISSSCAFFPNSDFTMLFVWSRHHFANLIEHGVYGRKNFRISPSWAIYHVKHMVNVSFQILLCRVPSREENLVDNRIT